MLTEDEVRRIRIYYQYGYTYMQIADAVDVHYSDIRKVIEEFKEDKKMSQGKKIPEEVLSEIPQLKEKGLTNRQIAEKLGIGIASVVHALTAYRAENKKSEPAPAATDTSSEETTLKNVSDISIAENPADVKCKIPQAVTDALAEEIIRLKGFIDEDSRHISCCRSRINEINNFMEKFGGAGNDE